MLNFNVTCAVFLYWKKGNNHALTCNNTGCSSLTPQISSWMKNSLLRDLLMSKYTVKSSEYCINCTLLSICLHYRCVLVNKWKWITFIIFQLFSIVTKGGRIELPASLETPQGVHKRSKKLVSPNKELQICLCCVGIKIKISSIFFLE